MKIKKGQVWTKANVEHEIERVYKDDVFVSVDGGRLMGQRMIFHRKVSKADILTKYNFYGIRPNRQSAQIFGSKLRGFSWYDHLGFYRQAARRAGSRFGLFGITGICFIFYFGGL